MTKYSLYLSDRQLKKLQTEAKRLDRPVSELIRRSIDEFIAKHK